MLDVISVGAVCWSHKLFPTSVMDVNSMLKGISISISHTSSAISRLIKILGTAAALYMIEIRHEPGDQGSRRYAFTRNHQSYQQQHRCDI